MKYRVTVENVKVSLGASDGEIITKARKVLSRISGVSVSNIHVRKKSIDARRKDNIILVCSVCGDAECSRREPPVFENVKFYEYSEETPVYGHEKLKARPVIIGFGPAGMFCAMELAANGYAPVVFERGGDIEDRTNAANKFISGGEFSDESNIQFGAGGAGTFSDGKLTTRIGDSLCEKVNSMLINLGAPEKIAYTAKPHIGTDVLREIVANADKAVRSAGGEIHYLSKAENISRDSVTVNGDRINYGALVLAIGHSARDTYSELMSSGYDMQPKPFSAGVRIEHLREDIDRAMYGKAADSGLLPSAEYALSVRRGDRGVYTFCMCPGGVVVPAASEAGGVGTNGMSYSLRDGVNSNAAIAVSVLPDDYGNTVEGAIAFQRKLERAAYEAGGRTFAAPAQTVGSFIRNGDNKPTKVNATYMNGNVVYTDISKILPPFISGMLAEGITDFGRKIKGFDSDSAILTGVETRTSAPLRIMRDDTSRTIAGTEIYPCGEGAGYAGGIMSAAVDGIRTARAIMARFAPAE